MTHRHVTLVRALVLVLFAASGLATVGFAAGGGGSTGGDALRRKRVATVPPVVPTGAPPQPPLP